MPVRRTDTSTIQARRPVAPGGATKRPAAPAKLDAPRARSVEPSSPKGFAILDALALKSPFQAKRTYDVAGASFTGAQLEQMRQTWVLHVLKRHMTTRKFRKTYGITAEQQSALKKQWPQDFGWLARRPERNYPKKIVDAAREVVERYHAGEMPYVALLIELRNLGIADYDHKELEKHLGMRIARRATRGYQTERRARFNAMADDIEALLAKHAWVVKKQTDLLDVLNASPAFKAKYPPQTDDGTYKLTWLKKLRDQDAKYADGRIELIFDAVKPEGKRGRRQPSGVGLPTVHRVVDVADDERSDKLSVREQMQSLAKALSGKQPSEVELKKAIAALEKQHSIQRPYKSWRIVMEKYKGVIPEFQRWRIGAKNEITLRYLAAWVQAMHDAGPAATVEDVQKVFARTPEFELDGRQPDIKVFSAVKQNPALGWEISPVKRGTWQLIRNMLEAVRTGPPGVDLKELLRTTKIQPQPEYQKAGYYLRQVLAGDLYPGEFDERVVRAIRERTTRAITGLGEKRDPRFDENVEPPWSPLAQAQKIASIPRVEDSPLFLHAIDRLDGRLPLENSDVMVIHHRYSDVIPLLDLFTRAGMSPKNACFVSTPYPFDPAFDAALADLGIAQEKHADYDLDAFAAAAERGIRRMIEQFDARKKKLGQGRPILILDDGGTAARLIEAKFKEHAHKFKVVEVTAAGHRVTAELKEKNLRVPFVYYSVAYSEAKRNIASKFYATRVVDRARAFSEATGVQPPNRRATVIGAGPMGKFAALRLKSLGYDVSIVDKSADVRREMKALGFRAYADTEMDAALKDRGTVLAMSGFKNIVGAQHTKSMMDGAVVVQGSSKLNDYDMAAIAKASTRKTEIRRDDGIPQKSFTYEFPGDKRLHFVGDGWTINHDGSLHGTPFHDVAFETVLQFESLVEAAGDKTTMTGDIKVVGADLQEEYEALWRKHHAR